MKQQRREPFDPETVHDVAAHPVESVPQAPAYLDPVESLWEVLAFQDLIVLRAQVVVGAAVERLDGTWHAHRRRSMEALREHTVGFVSHLLGGYLRDVAGQEDSPSHARAVQAAVEAAEQVGDLRLAEVPLPVTRWSLQEFFAPSRGTSRFNDVGDEMASAAVGAFVDSLSCDVGREVGRDLGHELSHGLLAPFDVRVGAS